MIRLYTVKAKAFDFTTNDPITAWRVLFHIATRGHRPTFASYMGVPS